jgi:hypothetical protein
MKRQALSAALALGAIKAFGKDQLNDGIAWGKTMDSYMNDGGVDLAPGPISSAPTCT